MRHDVGDPAVLRRIWKRELLPMLREHHIGQQEQIASWYPIETWLAELGLVGTADADEVAEASVVDEPVADPA